MESKGITGSTLIGLYAGEYLTEGDGYVIIGDNIKDLDRNQENVLFLGDKVAIGTTIFGEKINLKEVLEKLISLKK